MNKFRLTISHALAREMRQWASDEMASNLPDTAYQEDLADLVRQIDAEETKNKPSK